ncbi:MAG: YebC/PmpR family DNA-binding transcriptional regulator [Patescibacteria group bacterium]|nr:YebC/PmpR family DNA-binding transcriptional regulator [Patescibacteria group bacterium]
MSGHSKWATTHRQKNADDAKRGAVFTRLGRAITLAARTGANPEANFKLRIAIDQARAADMPKDNIERAIQRATGPADGAQLESVSYEGFGPHGVAMLVECLTDNRNRTGHEIRHHFEQHGGSIGSPGSVAWQFERSGVITVSSLSQDDELALIDLGVSDVRRSPASIAIICPPQNLEAVRKFFTTRGQEPPVKLAMLPKETKTLADPNAKTDWENFLRGLEEHPDVQDIYHNAVAG